MSRNVRSQLRQGLCALLAPLFVVACQAEPPTQFPFDAGSLSSGPYPSQGRCVRPGTTTCTAGTGCDGNNATGRPDNRSVNLRECGTLDLVFTSGTIVAKPTNVGEADLAVILPQGATVPSGVSVRVEGSEDGGSYKLIGFIGSFPGIPQNCQTTVETTPTGVQQVLVDASNCNHVANVNFLRFSEERPGTSDVMIDAVEALSFRSRTP